MMANNDENTNNIAIINGEDSDLNTLERFKRFELITQIGIGGTFLIGIIIAFWIEWINYRWWIIWPLAIISLRNLQRQRISLSKEKPYEARFANVFFLALIFLMIIRDLIITILIQI